MLVTVVVVVAPIMMEGERGPITLLLFDSGSVSLAGPAFSSWTVELRGKAETTLVNLG